MTYRNLILFAILLAVFFAGIFWFRHVNEPRAYNPIRAGTNVSTL